MVYKRQLAFCEASGKSIPGHEFYDCFKFSFQERFRVAYFIGAIYARKDL